MHALYTPLYNRWLWSFSVGQIFIEWLVISPWRCPGWWSFRPCCGIGPPPLPPSRLWGYSDWLVNVQTRLKCELKCDLTWHFNHRWCFFGCLQQIEIDTSDFSSALRFMINYPDRQIINPSRKQDSKTGKTWPKTMALSSMISWND